MVRLKLLLCLLKKKNKCNLKSRYSCVSDAFFGDYLENSLFYFISFLAGESETNPFLFLIFADELFVKHLRRNFRISYDHLI